MRPARGAFRLSTVSQYACAILGIVRPLNAGSALGLRGALAGTLCARRSWLEPGRSSAQELMRLRLYSEYDRPSTRRILTTAAGFVVAVGVVIGAAALAFGAMGSSAGKTAQVAPAAVAVAPVHVAKKIATVAPATPATATVATTNQRAQTVAPAPVVKPAAPAPRKFASGVVVIDAGHQAHGDSSLEPIGPGSSIRKPKVADGAGGVVSPHIPESQINLDVALKLEKVLKARGVKVIMVRTSQNVNIANSARAAIANKAHAALFVRLHCDGIGNSSTHGLSMLVPGTNQWTGPIVSESGRAGAIVDKAVLAATGAANRGIVKRTDLSGFNWSKVPTILPEMGFMSNPAEDTKLNSSAYQQKLANGLANGIVSYLRSR